MKLIKLHPPGTWCLNYTFFNKIKERKIGSFIEIGPGEGDLSKKLCSIGYTGWGVEFSESIIEILSSNMREFIEQGRYQIVKADIMNDDIDCKANLIFSMMVMEHIEDDISFLRKLKGLACKDGMVIIGVPGRRDRWGLEDEIYGHYRRYDSYDLHNLFLQVGFRKITVQAIGVPVSNCLFAIGNYITRISNAFSKKDLSIEEKTKLSGFKDVPFKTVFPVWCKIILNKYNMFPFMVLQKFFYNSNLGLTVMGTGYV